MTDGVMANGLERFVQAQEPVMEDVLAELARGRKQSHWMWFVFPQLQGLGRSAMAQRYGIRDLEEACAYLAHPVLGPRLVACCRRVLDHRGTAAEAVFGPIDAVKLRSCVTLFARVPGADPVFAQVLAAFFGGTPDPLTTERL